jgi:hypothetical protein
MHAKHRFNDSLKRAVEDPAMITQMLVVTQPLPKLRAEKFKSIESIVKAVGNKKYVDSLFAISTDSMLRMESIGRDDKRLPVKAKELYLLLQEFLVDCLFTPWTNACTTMLLKTAALKPQQSQLPPLEFMAALATLHSGAAKMRQHFDDIYLRPLSSQPNSIVICKESRRVVLRNLEIAARESLQAWTMCVVAHVDKTLQSLQGKYDYAPSKTTKISNEATAACNTVCKALLIVANSVRTYQADLGG